MIEEWLFRVAHFLNCKSYTNKHNRFINLLQVLAKNAAHLERRDL